MTNLSHESCKELKDAGFPQTRTDFTLPKDRERGTVEYVTMPTLSELIEACGKQLQTIYKSIQGFWCASNINAERQEWEDFAGLDCDGSTPEEAVKNLWLALHKS